MSSGETKKEYLFKILVIGELGAGKTSIIKRYVHQYFSQHYRATIGVDFALKIINWDNSTVIRAQLWDIAGQERFGNMTRVYYKEAVGCILVFDVTRPASFDAVAKWKADLDAKVLLPDDSKIPCLLLGNKCDQAREGFFKTPEQMDEYSRANDFIGWFEVSAKENINVDNAFKFLLSKEYARLVEKQGELIVSIKFHHVASSTIWLGLVLHRLQPVLRNLTIEKDEFMEWCSKAVDCINFNQEPMDAEIILDLVLENAMSFPVAKQAQPTFPEPKAEEKCSC